MNFCTQPFYIVIPLFMMLSSCGEEDISFKVKKKGPLKRFLESHNITIQVTSKSQTCNFDDVKVRFKFKLEGILKNGKKFEDEDDGATMTFDFGTLVRGESQTKTFELLDAITDSRNAIPIFNYDPPNAKSYKVNRLQLLDVDFDRHLDCNPVLQFFEDFEDTFGD